MRYTIMLRKLYVTSKAFGGKWEMVNGKKTLFSGNPILIGTLTELEKNKYQFEYHTKSLPHGNIIGEFPDLTRIYTGKDVDNFIYRIIPREDNIYASAIMKTYKITEYDVWDLLVACATFGGHDEILLFENLPEGTHTELNHKVSR